MASTVVNLLVSLSPTLAATCMSVGTRKKRKWFSRKYRGRALEISFITPILTIFLLDTAVNGPLQAFSQMAFQTLLALSLIGMVLLFSTGMGNLTTDKAWFQKKNSSYKFFLNYTIPLMALFQISLETFMISFLSTETSNSLVVPLLRTSGYKRIVQNTVSFMLITGLAFVSYLNYTHKGRSLLQKHRSKINELKQRYIKYERRAMRKWYAYSERKQVEFRAFKKTMDYKWNHPEGVYNKFFSQLMFWEPKYECGACLERKPRKRVPTFGSCKHRMCYPCLQKYIDECCNNAEGTNLECPYSDKCDHISKMAVNRVLNENDPTIDAQGIKVRLKKAYIRAGLMALQYVHVCPSPDCKNAVFSDHRLNEAHYLNPARISAERKARIEEEKAAAEAKQPKENLTAGEKKINKIKDLVKDIKKLTKYKVENGVDLRKFKCESCGYSSCVVCKEMWTYGAADHNQKTCQEYHEEALIAHNNPAMELTAKQLKEQKEKGLMKYCPRCDTLIQKNEGCRHMTCSQCKYEFCWICLGKYGNCAC